MSLETAVFSPSVPTFAKWAPWAQRLPPSQEGATPGCHETVQLCLGSAANLRQYSKMNRQTRLVGTLMEFYLIRINLLEKIRTSTSSVVWQPLDAKKSMAQLEDPGLSDSYKLADHPALPETGQHVAPRLAFVGRGPRAPDAQHLEETVPTLLEEYADA